MPEDLPKLAFMRDAFGASDPFLTVAELEDDLREIAKCVCIGSCLSWVGRCTCMFRWHADRTPEEVNAERREILVALRRKAEGFR